MQFLYFTVNEAWLAIDITYVDEILIPSKMQASGEIMYGDKNIPLLNLREHLFGKVRGTYKDFRLIICNIDSRQFALQVDSAEEIAMVDPNAIGDAEKSGIDFSLNFTEGVIREENRLVYVLSPRILKAIPKRA
jgi:chemotaxis signal transduction protein